MNYKKQLLTIIGSVLLAINIYAQAPQINEVWVLDSIKIQETSEEPVRETIIYPNQRWILDQFWMKQFSVKEGNSIDCILMNDSEHNQVIYSIVEGNNWTFHFSNFGALQQYKMQLILPDKLTLTHEYKGAYQQNLISGIATFYYHKN